MPTQTEIERRYIIRMPEMSRLCQQEDYRESEIEQIYLPAARGQTHRIRARTADGQTVYTETRKTRLDGMSALEQEEVIDGERYRQLAAQRAPDTQPLHKRRCTFTYRGALYEVDIYPQWPHTAILETELPSRDCQRPMPQVLCVLCEVTGDQRYSNASLSRHFPQELTQATPAPNAAADPAGK